MIAVPRSTPGIERPEPVANPSAVETETARSEIEAEKTEPALAEIVRALASSSLPGTLAPLRRFFRDPAAVGTAPILPEPPPAAFP